MFHSLDKFFTFDIHMEDSNIAFHGSLTGCNQLIVVRAADTISFVETNENFDGSDQESAIAGLRAGLRALFGYDLEVVQRELEWVEENLDADESMPYVASILRAIVNELRGTDGFNSVGDPMRS